MSLRDFYYVLFRHQRVLVVFSLAAMAAATAIAATHSFVPGKSDQTLVLALGLLIGGSGSIGLAFLLDRLDHTFRGLDDVRKRLQVPALSAIPDVHLSPVHPTLANGKGRQLLRPAAGAAREVAGDWDFPARMRNEYESLVSRLLGSIDAPPATPRLFAVTSCRQGEGVTSVATNIAAGLARLLGERVLLVDGGAIGRASANGRARHLVAAYGRDDEFLRTYAAPGMIDLLAAMEKDYSMIVLDLPPIVENRPPGRLLDMVDGVVLVLEADRARWEVAEKATEVLAESRARVLGAVLNRRRFPIPGWLYKTL
jgi:Mrp family chromosome partitioning ATPase